MHKSVLLQETIENLQLTKGDLAIDATTGAGGHTKEMAAAVGSGGKVLGIDRDENALAIARSIFRGENVTLAHASFENIEEVANKNGFGEVDGILADLGVSSMQLDDPARGFSFKSRGVLDMRMDQTGHQDAFNVVNMYSEDDLTRIFKQYGQERNARRVACAIVNARESQEIRDTDQLAEVVRGVAFVRRTKGDKKIDPATKVFQAIRIEVNQELKQLETALPQMVRLLKPGGRLAIITFHSLEDRIVKNFYREQAKECVCPPDYPTCKCDHEQTLRVISRKPIVPCESEIKTNPRSRSAKLRVAEKI